MTASSLDEHARGVEVSGRTDPASPLPLHSFDVVYETHFDFVWRNLRRLGVEDGAVDDAAHDVFLVVHRQLGQFDGRSYRSWLFAIAQRVAWHYRRSRARRRTEPLYDEELGADSSVRPDVHHDKREACVVVNQILERLPDERRAVFVLAELEQMSMPQIAEILAIPLNTAYSRLRLARRDFSRALRHLESSCPRSTP
jgi:RNA polymerase sigma-70 factor (ECF subfamily)